MNEKIAKYKIDDKVKMGPKVWQEVLIKKSPHPNYMAIAPDKIVTIVSNKGDGIYELEFGELVHEFQILGYAFEYGEEIEVSDDGKKWFREVFSTYDASSENLKVVTFSHMVRYARPVQDPPEVIERNNTVLSDCSMVEIGREIIRREEG